MNSKANYFPLVLIIAGSVVWSSCVNGRQHPPGHSADADRLPAVSDQSDRILALLWFRCAAEAQALYFQAYNVAMDRLDAVIDKSRPEDRLAVITDIDETILDNSPYQIDLVKHGHGYSNASWTNWSRQGAACALPGAQQFLTHAAARGVDVFYISNRNTNEFSATERNLKAQHFPMVDRKHLLLQEAKEGKESKRRMIQTNYTVVLLVGDQLGDFSSDFNDLSSCTNRSRVTDLNREKFGREFILLPNPMYGGWEDVFYPSSFQTEEETVVEKHKAERRRKLLGLQSSMSSTNCSDSENLQ